MIRTRKQESGAATNVFQFTLSGLIIFSLTIAGGASFVAYKLAAVNHPDLQADTYAENPKDKTRSVHVGPWGELRTRDIELERPVEYMTEEASHPHPENWTFAGMNRDAVKALLMGKGLKRTQVETVLKTAVEDAAGTRLTPDMPFLQSLDAATRAKLCVGLAGMNVNLYYDNPYTFPGGNLDSLYADEQLNQDDVRLLKQLVYINGSVPQFSDYDALMSQIPTVKRRLDLSQAMSRQSAVVAGLIIKPDTDIDKIAAYWGNLPNVRFTDIRPLMVALKALPEGGNLSLLYFLPKFARDRLYTYPLPPQPGDPILDCHWTTFNFFNDTPDNRFNDPNYAIPYIQKNFYRIAAPSLCGDILLLVNDRNEILHSAVYLANDIVFTKNGNNYRQPWMLMRIPDLVATYPNTPPVRVIYMRHKAD
jgi:hypothetical protein